ncbi:MAG: hypothetical protein ABI718_03800 [Acidobacteriota bacterium]
MKKIPMLLGVVAVVSIFAIPAHAQELTWGVRAGVFGDNADPIVGAEAIIPLTDRIFFNPNVEALFSDSDGNQVIANADAHYDFSAPPDRFIWAGAGLAGLIGGKNKDFGFGLNVLAGYGWDRKTWEPYIQGKFVLADNNKFELAAGVRF